MPYVIVKMNAGRSDADKKAMADRVASALHDTMGHQLENVSVAVEEIDPADWMDTVYGPDIAARQDKLARSGRRLARSA